MEEPLYYAKDAGRDIEQRRLGYLQQMFVNVTPRRLEAAGVTTGWRCVDVGAGEGSVAKWLASKVGPEGHVVATDLNPRLLQALSGVEVRKHDIQAESLEEGAFDLVHCRALLTHLSDPGQALRHMVAALKPGGVLCVEEGDFSFFGPADLSHPEADRFLRATRTFVDALPDMSIGRRVRGILEGLGLTGVQHDGHIAVSRGGDPSSHFYRLSLEIGRKMMLASGQMTEEDLDWMDGIFRDRSFLYMDVAMFAAWGRKPG